MGYRSITISAPSLIQSKNNPEKGQYTLSVHLLQFFIEKKTQVFKKKSDCMMNIMLLMT